MVEAAEIQQDPEEVEVAPEVFEQNSGLLMNDYEKDFYVRNPQDNNGHIVYECRGKDSQGVWEGKRRYSEFHELYVALCKRWPGIAIPGIPPKKAIGNKDRTFVQDRTFYLQRFMRKAARYTFIIESPEFMIFSRPQGLKIDSALGKLMPLTTQAKYDRIREATGIDESIYEVAQKEIFGTKIVDFVAFEKRIQPLFQNVKNGLAKQLTTKQYTIMGYQELVKIVDRYEELNLQQYTDMKGRELIFNNPDNKALKDQQPVSASALRNPYIDLYHWVKGELYDMAAICQVVAARREVIESLRNMQAKKSNTQKDIQNVTQGKTTATTLFKSSSDSAALATKVDNYDREITQLQKLVDLLTCYIAEVTLKSFKEEKIDLYRRMLQQFTLIEINNAHTQASFWSTVLQNPKVKAAC